MSRKCKNIIQYKHNAILIWVDRKRIAIGFHKRTSMNLIREPSSNQMRERDQIHKSINNRFWERTNRRIDKIIRHPTRQENQID